MTASAALPAAAARRPLGRWRPFRLALAMCALLLASCVTDPHGTHGQTIVFTASSTDLVARRLQDACSGMSMTVDQGARGASVSPSLSRTVVCSAQLAGADEVFAMALLSSSSGPVFRKVAFTLTQDGVDVLARARHWIEGRSRSGLPAAVEIAGSSRDNPGRALLITLGGKP